MFVAAAARMSHGFAHVAVSDLVDEVILLRVGGILTPESAGEIRRWGMDLAQRAGALGQVWDCRSAVVAIGPDAMATAARRLAQSVGAGPAPAALLVAPAHFELFRGYCWQAAQHGVNTAPFTDFSTALDWAQRQVLVHRAWPAMSLPPACFG